MKSCELRQNHRLEEDVCITSGIGGPDKDDGRPVASNHWVERDQETQRLAFNSSNKDCKKRQCKAITFKDPASLSDAIRNGIIALIRVSNPASRSRVSSSNAVLKSLFLCSSTTYSVVPLNLLLLNSVA